MKDNNEHIISEIFSKAINEGIKSLSLDDSRKILDNAGIPFNLSHLAKSQEDAITIAKRIGYPVAMKIVSPQIIHKTEVDGVKVKIGSEQEVKENFIEMINNAKKVVPNANIKGILIEEMVEGPEFIVGTTQDSQFGPMLMFGVGGIFVEVYKDVSFRLIPITKGDALDMLNELRGNALLKGIRGLPKADPEELVDILIRVSNLIEKYNHIKELDINPLVITDAGAKAVDARIILN